MDTHALPSHRFKDVEMGQECSTLSAKGYEGFRVLNC